MHAFVVVLNVLTIGSILSFTLLVNAQNGRVPHNYARSRRYRCADFNSITSSTSMQVSKPYLCPNDFVSTICNRSIALTELSSADKVKTKVNFDDVIIYVPVSSSSKTSQPEKAPRSSPLETMSSGELGCPIGWS